MSQRYQQGQRSPDGRWWWDGRQWQPVQPQFGTPSSRGTGGATRVLLIVGGLGAIFLVAVLGVWVYLVYQKDRQLASRVTVPRASAPAAPQVSPTPSLGPDGPVACGGGIGKCFASIDLSGDIVGPLAAQGYACSQKDATNVECSREDKATRVTDDLTIETDAGKINQLQLDVLITRPSSAPSGPPVAEATAPIGWLAALPFKHSPGLAGQARTWAVASIAAVSANVGGLPAKTFGGYHYTCGDQGGNITVGDLTTASTGCQIYAELI